MLLRIVLYFSGIFFSSIGIHFIISKPECLIIFLGIFNIYLALKRKGKNNGLRI